jgi:hypothetical protein
MRKFLVGSGIVALIITASWIDFFPVRCDVCRGFLFRTDFAAILFGGHGSVIHWNCLPSVVDNTPSDMRLAPPSPVNLSLPLPLKGATLPDAPDLPG